MLDFSTKKCYTATISELKRSLSQFFQEKYKYQPIFHVYLDTMLQPMPVKVNIEMKNEDSFFIFWNQLHQDIFRLKNKRRLSEEFEFGDKVLRLMLGQDIDYYFFDEEYDEEFSRKEDTVYLFTGLFSSLSFEEEEEIVQKKIAGFQQLMTPFLFQEKDFLSLQTEKIKLIEVENDILELNMGRKEICICLSFSYENYKPISFSMYTDFHSNKLNITIFGHGICITREMKAEVHHIAMKLKKLCQQKLAHLSPTIEIKKNIPYIDDLPITSFEGLNDHENKILSLHKLHKLEYEIIFNHLNMIPTENVMERMEHAYIKYLTKELSNVFDEKK